MTRRAAIETGIVSAAEVAAVTGAEVEKVKSWCARSAKSYSPVTQNMHVTDAVAYCLHFAPRPKLCAIRMPIGTTALIFDDARALKIMRWSVYCNKAIRHVLKLVSKGDLLQHSAPVKVTTHGYSVRIKDFDARLHQALTLLGKACRCSIGDVFVWCIHIFKEN